MLFLLFLVLINFNQTHFKLTKMPEPQEQICLPCRTTQTNLECALDLPHRYQVFVRLLCLLMKVDCRQTTAVIQAFFQDQYAINFASIFIKIMNLAMVLSQIFCSYLDSKHFYKNC